MTESKKIKVLCAEDESDIRENITEILRDEGFEVFEADNGKHGFESFLQNKPDIIISDIMMPEVDGYGLLKLVRESKNTRHNTIPFIFLTALGQKDNLIKGINLSANDYMVKPIDFDLLIAKIKEKVLNASKVTEVHHRDIKNIKSQISVVLPSAVFAYLDIISQTSSILKEEPYGPFPHRRYVEELDKIYMNSVRIRAAIANALDESAIDNKINTDEEIFVITNFLDEFIAGLSEKFRSHINFEHPFEAESMPQIKVDRLVLHDALRKILSGIFKTDLETMVTITIMLDHLNNMIIIFHIDSKLPNSDFIKNTDESQVSKILDKQTCRFEIVDNKENRDKSAILTIPSYRLIEK